MTESVGLEVSLDIKKAIQRMKLAVLNTDKCKQCLDHSLKGLNSSKDCPSTNGANSALLLVSLRVDILQSLQRVQHATLKEVKT